MDLLKRSLRPRTAWLLIRFSLVYIAIIEVIFPLLNATFGWTGERALPQVAHDTLLALILTQPLAYVISRSVEKVKGAEKNQIGPS